MITEQEYKDAIAQVDKAQETINQYHRERQQKFDDRMRDNPIFTDDELRYSAYELCPCGHGLAYPKDCGPRHYWDCSAILKGTADPKVQHTAKLPFMFYNIKSEDDNSRVGTTRDAPKNKGNDA